MLAAALIGGLFLGQGGQIGLNLGGAPAPVYNYPPQETGLLEVLLPVVLIGGVGMVGLYFISQGKTPTEGLSATNRMRLEKLLSQFD